ncbi:hypothetical protein LO762_25840 [Actinocorallia sp. API 0066]|nr:hypothetical protein [Actinocorallia sp. API 0066]MCD0452577.1 hypothetical protein [Actinocorallia sp. API 0066]
MAVVAKVTVAGEFTQPALGSGDGGYDELFDQLGGVGWGGGPGTEVVGQL